MGAVASFLSTKSKVPASVSSVSSQQPVTAARQQDHVSNQTYEATIEGQVQSSGNLNISLAESKYNRLEIGVTFSPITPRRQWDLDCSVPFTPVGEDVNKFKYYCPICMNYYKDILKSSCCGNYTCLSCCKEYLCSHNIIAETVNEILSSTSYLSQINCPNCSTIGFNPQMVVLSEDVRDYSTKFNAETQPYGEAKHQLASPLKVGDTFEDLKRKMVLYQKHSTSTINIDAGNVVHSSETSSYDPTVRILGRVFDSDTTSVSVEVPHQSTNISATSMIYGRGDTVAVTPSTHASSMIHAIIATSLQSHNR